MTWSKDPAIAAKRRRAQSKPKLCPYCLTLGHTLKTCKRLAANCAPGKVP